MSQAATHSLAAAIWPATTRNKALRFVVLVVASTLLLTLSAKIKVPFWPVEMTLQPLAVVALGLALGSRLALATVALYVAQGALGLPVFTGTPEKGIGLAYMVGPTGGYIAGFVLASAVVGLLADRGWSRSIPLAFAAALIGMACIYAPGLAWMTHLFGVEKALVFGFWPFVLGDLVKALIAAIGVPMAWQLIQDR
jgi:biotin transport system substrate-specific component